MPTQIDSKVVEMRFDNKQFESGISQSMDSLNKLKATLDFSGVIDNSTLKGISDGIDWLTSRFSVFGEVIQNIKHQALDLVKSLTIDQVTSGWGKYAEITRATQTIMSATRQEWEDQGAQMEYVNEQLEKLNWFTDETSYNLTDMTGNIGKFTAAGIELDKATTAMMGIATWAGLSGAGVEQASRAMYNLSQAMALGSVRVQDWMSIENANMATKEFKETAIQTAYQLGVLKKASDGTFYALDSKGKKVAVTVESFRATLSAGWFNADVLTTALKKYGDFADGLYEQTEKTGLSATQMLKYIQQVKDGSLDLANTSQMGKLAADLQTDVGDLSNALSSLSDDYYDLGFAAFRASQEAKTFQEAIDYTKDAASTGWMNTFRTIFGDYLESKELWTAVTEEMYDVFLEDLDKQNNVLKQWGELGGREKLLEAVSNLWGNIKDIIFNIKGAFGNIFPPSSAEKLYDLTEKFRKFTYVISITERQSQMLKDMFGGVFSVVKSVHTSFKNLLKVAADALDFNDLLPKDLFKSGGVIEWISNIVEEFKQLFYINSITEKQAKGWFDSFSNAFRGVKNIAQSVVNIFRALGEAFLKIFPPSSEGIIEKLINIFANLTETFKITDERAEKLRRLFEGLFAVLDIVRMLISALLAPFVDLTGSTENLADGVFDVVASFGDWLVSIRDWLKEHDTFTKAISAVVQFFKDLPGKIDQATYSLTGMHLDEIFNRIKESVKNAWEYIKGIFTSVDENLGELKNQNEGFAESVEGNEKSISVFERIKNVIDKIRQAFETVKPYIDQFFEMFKDNVDFKMPTLEEFGDGLVKGGKIAVLASLTAVLVKFFQMINNGEKIEKSISGLFNTLSSSIKTLTGALAGNIKAQTFKTVATSILELAAAVFVLALLPEEKLMSSMLVVSGLMLELAAAFNIISTTKTSEKKLTQIKGMLGTLELIFATLVGGIYLLASQADIDAVMGAAMSLGLLFGEIALFFLEMDKIKITEKKVKNIGNALMSISVVLVALGGAMALASSSGDAAAIAAAGVSMAAMLFAIAGAMSVMPDGKKMKEAAGGLALVSLSLIEIAAAFAIMSLVPVESLMASVAALGIMVTVLATALGLLAGKDVLKGAGAIAIAATGILLLASAFAIMGSLDPSAMALSLVVLGGALAAILVAGVAAAEISVGLTALAVAAAALGVAALAAGAGMWLFADGIAKIATIGPDGVMTILMALEGFFNLLPMMATRVGEAFINFIKVMTESREVILEGFVTAIEILLDALIKTLPKVLELVKDVIIGIIDTVVELMPKILELIRVIFDALIQLIWEQTPVLTDTLIMLVKESLIALRAITNDLTQTAIGMLLDLLHAIKDNIAEVVELSIEIIGEIVAGLLEGLKESIPRMADAGFDFIIGLLNGISDAIENNAQAFRDAMINVATSMINAFRTVLGIHSPSTVFEEDGENIILGLIQGIAEKIPEALRQIGEFVSDLLKTVADKMTEWCIKGNEALDNFRAGIREKWQEVKNFIAEKFQEATKVVAEKILEWTEKGKQAIENIKSGIESKWNQFKIYVRGFVDNAKTAIVEKFNEWVQVGKDAIDGLRQGFEKAAKKAVDAAKKVANDALKAAKNLLGIASPSKAFEQVGMYSDEGFAKGLSKYSSVVTDATEDVGENALNSMRAVVTNLSDIVNSEIDSNPTIRPILDLSDVTNGIAVVDDLISAGRSIDLATSSGTIFNNNLEQQYRMNAMMEELKNTLSGVLENQNGVVNNNTFNIKGDNPKEIANEVSKILQNQVERDDAVWAL